MVGGELEQMAQNFTVSKRVFKEYSYKTCLILSNPCQI
jgi:hypothetical protein